MLGAIFMALRPYLMASAAANAPANAKVAPHVARRSLIAVKPSVPWT
jgi:hypothetical protein